MSGQKKQTVDSVIGYMKVPAGLVDYQCSEDHLRELSRHVYDWETILGFLGFENARAVESRIRTQYPWGLQQQTTQMFLEWRDFGRKEATYRKLIGVFVRLQKTAYAEKLCELIIQTPPKPPTVEKVERAPVGETRRVPAGEEREARPEPPRASNHTHTPAPDTTATSQHADSDILGQGHFLEITEYLHTLTDKTDISSLGLVLGLYPDRLKPMEQNSHNFLDDVVYAWLRREGDVDKRGGPKWSTLVNALMHRRLKQTGIANTISRDKGLGI